MTVLTSPELQELVDLVRQGAEANERPDLVRRMRTAAETIAGPEPVQAEVAATVVRALKSLEVDLRARRATLSDPGRGARFAAESRHAETLLRRFQDRAAKWPRMLGDALSAADSDIEYGVQSRLRALLDEGTAVIESSSMTAEDLEKWLRERLLTEVESCQRALRSAADVVAGRLTTSLDLTVAVPPVALALESPEDVLAQLHRRPAGAGEKQPLAGKLLGIIMPTYSGMMVALVLPRLFGLKLPIWLIATVAVVGACGMGGAALAGERQRQISRRNAETIGVLRSTTDAFRLVISKQVRDAVRDLDELLRAGLDEAVTKQTRRLSGAADSSRRAAENIGRTAKALTDIDEDLESVRELRARAERLAQ